LVSCNGIRSFSAKGTPAAFVAAQHDRRCFHVVFGGKWAIFTS
jgi:hypothetical protein